MGPGSVIRDRFDYSGAVGESWKTQMLLNLVKMRYGDIPVFMDVGTVVAGYSLQRTLSATGSANTFNQGPPLNAVTSTLGATAGVIYNDSPTITYTPMAGERFARSMMANIPPSSVMNVLQAGFPVDVVLRLAVQSINGIDNRRVAGGISREHVRPANPEFYLLLEQLGRIQNSGDLGVRVAIDNRTDRDEGWSVEGRLPWTDFARTGGRPAEGDVWRFALCRYDYGPEGTKPVLMSSAPLTQSSFHRHEDYGSLTFEGPPAAGR